MVFADLKNDFVFRRIFATHPDILRGLLNDLLGRQEEQTIEAIDLPPGPHREALELANKSTFTQAELDAYQKVMDEIQQAREYGEVKWAEGKAVGLIEGLTEGQKSGIAEGKRDILLRLLTRAEITLSEDDRARIQACTDAATLDHWVDNVLGAKTATDVLS